MSTLRIFLPTRGRLHRQITMREWYLQELDVPVVIVHPQCERDAWKTNKLPEHFEFLEVPDAYNFSEVRQHILEQEGDRHLVLDDDLFLYRRLRPLKKLKKATKWDVFCLLDRLDKYMDQGYVHGGVGFRAFNNQYVDGELEKENMVCICAHFYRADVLKNEEHCFDAIPGKCDLHTTLSLLERGYPNIVTNEWVHHQECSLKASQGGVARYRTPEFVNQTSMMLQQLHPEVVALRHKTQKDGSKVIETRIQWKKAFCLKEHLRKWTM